MRRHLRFVSKTILDPLKQRAASSEHDASVHDVRGELGRRTVERLLDRIDDLRDGLLERAADLLAREHDCLREARDHVAAADLRLDLLPGRKRSSDLQLDLLGRLLADQQFVLALYVADDRLIELVAADAD